MTRIIIQGVSDRQSLLSALQVVLEVMNRDDAFDYEQQVFTPTHSDEPEDNPVEPDMDIATAPGNQGGPMPYVPCPARGTHDRLTDCWMCWSDVMRGAAIEPEVLSPEAWYSEDTGASEAGRSGSSPDER